MRIYIASRTKHRNWVNKLYRSLESIGHIITYDWTKLGALIPYDEHSVESSKHASKISQAIFKTDIFILISDSEGTDMFVELGIAIASAEKNHKPKIYIVGKFNKRSLMHYHPLINHIDSMEEALKIIT